MDNAFLVIKGKYNFYPESFRVELWQFKCHQVEKERRNVCLQLQGLRWHQQKTTRETGLFLILWVSVCLGWQGKWKWVEASQANVRECASLINVCRRCVRYILVTKLASLSLSLSIFIWHFINCFLVFDEFRRCRFLQLILVKKCYRISSKLFSIFFWNYRNNRA